MVVVGALLERWKRRFRRVLQEASESAESGAALGSTGFHVSGAGLFSPTGTGGTSSTTVTNNSDSGVSFGTDTSLRSGSSGGFPSGCSGSSSFVSSTGGGANINDKNNNSNTNNKFQHRGLFRTDGFFRQNQNQSQQQSQQQNPKGVTKEGVKGVPQAAISSQKKPGIFTIGCAGCTGCRRPPPSLYSQQQQQPKTTITSGNANNASAKQKQQKETSATKQSSATSASSCYSSASYATSSFSSSTSLTAMDEELLMVTGGTGTGGGTGAPLEDHEGGQPLTMRAIKRGGGGTTPAAEHTDVNRGDLNVVATLGVGGFGRVQLVKHRETDKLFALKVLNKAHVAELNQKEHVLSERSIQLECRSDFIVRLYRTFRDPEKLYMLMEYCAGGEVWTALRNWGHFDESTARFYCAAALEAFDYLHRRLIVYRDLKPENMLLDAHGVPKLADFGFAKRLRDTQDRAWTFCGTAEYVAPEVILNKGQDCGVDLWSLGIFLYELIAGQPPFASPDPMHTYNAILKGVQMLAWPRYMTADAKLLVCKLCRRNPADRLGYASMDELRQDPWFRGFDWVAFRMHTMRAPIRPKLRSPTDTQNFDRYPATDSFATGADESGWDEQF